MKIGVDYIGVGVGAVIINDKNQILLLKRKKNPELGLWSIPGGKVEFGETIEDAVKREVYEELGVTIKIIKLLSVTNHIISMENQHWISPSFLVEIISGIPINKEQESHEKIKWFSINGLPKCTITTLESLKKYFQNT